MPRLQADANTVDVWDIDLCAGAPIGAGDLASALSDDERQRAKRFGFTPDRQRYCAARLLLRTLLAHYTKRQPQDIAFVYGRCGKPRLMSDATCRDIRFNVSHTRSRALFAFAHDADIGIDIEEVRQDMPVLDIARSCFTGAELALLLHSPEHRRQSLFFDVWVRKEAVAKATGLGLSLDLKTFDVLPLPVAAPCLRWVERERIVRLQQLDVGSDFAAALAVATERPYRIRHILAKANDIIHSGDVASDCARGEVRSS